MQAVSDAGFFDLADGVRNFRYDFAGNLDFERASVGGNWSEERASFYSADGRLRAVETRELEGQGLVRTFEEYRYDALGRRIWVRMVEWCEEKKSMTCVTPLVRRTVWDGDQELAEIQVPGGDGHSAFWEQDTPAHALGFDPSVVPGDLPTSGGDPNTFYGRVIYTPGLSIDQPLSIVRLGYRDQPDVGASASEWTPFAIYPHWNARGVAPSGTLASGGWTRWYDMSLSSTGCLPMNDTTGLRCLILQWTAGYGAYDQKRGVGQHWRAWHGSLLTQKRDGSGLEYKRNRQYDPQTGRFTQQDPIGLAGGWNLYGFAAGDPVNFSDPFGLCPQWLTGRPCSGGVDLAAGFVPGLSTGVDLATALSGENPRSGESVGWVGRGIAVAGVLTPVSGGHIRGLLTGARHALSDGLLRITAAFSDRALRNTYRGAIDQINRHKATQHFYRGRQACPERREGWSALGNGGQPPTESSRRPSGARAGDLDGSRSSEPTTASSAAGHAPPTARVFQP